MVDLKYLSDMSEVVDLIGTEVFYRKELSVIVSGLPHIGKAAGGERTFQYIGRYQGQSLRHDARRWEDPVDPASFSQCSETAVVNF